MIQMISIKRIAAFVMLLSFFAVSSCNNEKQVKKEGEVQKEEPDNAISNADKIVYSFRASSVAPQYHRSYSIAVTENNLHLAINSYSDTLLTKDWTFTKEKFNEVKGRLKNLKEDGEINESEIPDGGTSQFIILYQKDKKIFDGDDYGRTKNFTGADIDLSYLIPDLKELIESTKMKNE